MIRPTEKDIGRAVVYRPPGGAPEEGVITGMNEWHVLVRYGADRGSKATSRDALEWVTT